MTVDRDNQQAAREFESLELAEVELSRVRLQLKEAQDELDRLTSDLARARAGGELAAMDAIVAAFNSWPPDIRKKLSFHDIRRMSGWSNRPNIGDWRIDTSAGCPILVYQNCSVIEGDQAWYLINLIKSDNAKSETITSATPDSGEK